jgi:hypothetical protein
MANYVKFNHFVEELGKGTHQLHAAGHTLKVYLTNNTPDADADSVKGDLAGITEENGYTATDIQNDYTEASGTGTLTGVDIVFTAVVGNFGPFRYAVIYNSSASDKLICYWDRGSSLTCYTGDTFTVDFGASICTLT